MFFLLLQNVLYALKKQQQKNNTKLHQINFVLFPSFILSQCFSEKRRGKHHRGGQWRKRKETKESFSRRLYNLWPSVFRLRDRQQMTPSHTPLPLTAPQSALSCGLVFVRGCQPASMHITVFHLHKKDKGSTS